MQQVTRIGYQLRPTSSRHVLIGQGSQFCARDLATRSRKKRDLVAELNERLTQPVDHSLSAAVEPWRNRDVAVVVKRYMHQMSPV